MNRIYFFVLLLGLYVFIDIYVFNVVRTLVADYSTTTRRVVYGIYWLFSVLVVAGLVVYNQLDSETYKGLKVLITSAFFINLVSKVFAALVILGDDVRRGVVYLSQFFGESTEKHMPGRSEFMAKSALIAGALPLATFSFGIISGAHDYRVRKRVITSPNLPKEFDGIRIAQLSDIHTGSFFNKTAVQGGVDLLNAQKPDLVCFTGDLVNNQSDEAKPYLDIFKKVDAPLGVHSTMGNHDYGDYRGWSTKEAKIKDVAQLHDMHRYMGWNIMLNENKTIKVDGAEIALLGLENWGAGGFSKYGDMEKTYKGTEEIPYKILLSHDPSHWDAQVRPQYPDVDLMLAGHTHGMQFGIEIGDWRWSPSKFVYKQWADLYQEGNQYLYVNRGYGFIGYPGRVGILPEITILELKRA
jgi:predicted MPP superfamily phosphohydrolase